MSGPFIYIGTNSIKDGKTLRSYPETTPLQNGFNLISRTRHSNA